MNISASMPNTEADQLLHVVAAVIQNSKKEVLITRRHPLSHQGSLWEFPGGKVEAGETAKEALERELYEELNIHVHRATPLLKVRHAYPEKSVLLDVWRIDAFEGIPYGKEGQPLRYQKACDLQTADFPAANHAIIRTLALPEIYAISAVEKIGPAKFLQLLETALAGGLKLLQFREPELATGEYNAVAQEVIALCRSYGARVLVNADADTAMMLGADGVHLNSKRLMQSVSRPLPGGMWVAASCHDDKEIAQANSINADFAVLSPVLPTPSHPDARTLGWSRFRYLARNSSIPVYALGGMNPDSIEEAKGNGAIGCAMISQFWSRLAEETKPRGKQD